MYIADTAASSYGEAYLESPDERVLYAYVAELARLSPDEALAKHHLLLTEANAPGNQRVQQALQRMVLDNTWERNGLFVINRCFYGLRNPWLASGDREAALCELIQRVKRDAPYRPATARHLRRLRQTLTDYIHSDQYAALEWNLRLLKTADLYPLPEDPAPAPLHHRFRDQFYLHEVLTATPDIPSRQQAELRRQASTQARAVHSHLRTFLTTGKTPKGLIRYREFGSPQALRDCLNHLRPDRDDSIWYAASRLAERVRRMTMDDICNEVYHFVLEPLARVDARYSPGLNQMIQGKIRKEINRGREERQGSGGNQFTEMAITTICGHLLKFLVVESNQNYQNSLLLFRRLLDQVGPTAVVETLLRITLFWPRVRFVLEERFGILFQLYQNRTSEEVPWLSKILEHMKVGLALNGEHLNYFSLA
jgi:hypothetical protein